MYGSINNNKSTDLIATTIKYLNNKLLDVIDNNDIWILTSKSEERCTHCWDNIRKQVNNDKCPYCYGSAHEGGYDKPIKSRMSYLVFPEAIKLRTDYIGDRPEFISPISVWLQTDIKVNAGDIIVDVKNDRFLIDSVQYTNKNNDVIIRQIIGMKRIPKDHIMYKIPIPKEINISCKVSNINSNIIAE